MHKKTVDAFVRRNTLTGCAKTTSPHGVFPAARVKAQLLRHNAGGHGTAEHGPSQAKAREDSGLA